MGGYGVSLVGHCHPKIVQAIKEQCERLLSCHSSLYNDKRAELIEKLIRILPKGLTRMFLSNSGAEAIECAIKIAVKYTGKNEFISMIRGYHGKTLGALSATWNPKYRDPFKSILVPSFKFTPFGRIDRAEDAVTDKTAAIIIEPIQGEGGVHLPPDDFLKEIRRLCDERGILLIMDEIQTGLGRTGKMWASEHWNVKPDIICISKALASGIPIGVTAAREDIMNSLSIGEHTSTFSGNPIACAAASATIDVILEEKLVERARNIGEYFKRLLLKLQDKHPIIRDVRGLGLMIGLEFRFSIHNILSEALRSGVLLLHSGRNIIRFLPPLVIEKKHLENVVDILDGILRKEERRIKTAR